MFTQKEIAENTNAARPFAAKAKQYLALLAEFDLPVSVNHSHLVGVLQSQLFAKLLAVDAGLKMRFEMLRTEEAQQNLIATTIDMSGYAVVDQLKASIQQLEGLYNTLLFRQHTRWMTPAREGITLSYLASAYNLDINAWLESQKYNWAGREHVLKHFQHLAEELQQILSFQRAFLDASSTLQHVVSPFMAGLFQHESPNAPIVPDEHNIMRNIVGPLNAAGKLAGFPGNMR